MESTTQCWRPVWDALECDWQRTRRARADAGPTSGALHLAQPQSNHGPHGRKRDFPDAERLVKRLVAEELTLSFVRDVTQRLWRTVTRRKYQLPRNRRCRIASSPSWKRRSRSRSPVWSRISSGQVRGGCSTPLPAVRRCRQHCGTRQCAAARHGSAVARCARGGDGSASPLPPAGRHDARGIAGH
jgi:hypothetical protein